MRDIHNQVSKHAKSRSVRKPVTEETRRTANKLLNFSALRQMFRGVTEPFMYTFKNISQNYFQIPVCLDQIKEYIKIYFTVRLFRKK